MTKNEQGTPIVEPLDSSALPANVAVITSRLPYPAILESLKPSPAAGRYSAYAANPLRILAVDASDPRPLSRLSLLHNDRPRVTPDYEGFPYGGGWIGHISYEAGTPSGLVKNRSGERQLPVVRFGLYDHLLIFDNTDGQWWGVAVDWPYSACRSSAADRLDSLRAQLTKAGELEPTVVGMPEAVEFEAFLNPDQYRSRVERIKRHIESGDIYQANLAQRFRMHSDAPAFEFYQRVREHNPSAFSAFLSWDRSAIVSASPELFLQLRGDRVITRPIKGTRPRTGDAHFDRIQRAELAQSDKDRSELNMIIDLLRNDLGRVCAFGSIHVTDVGSIEEHPTVFHRVATIEGRLAQGRTWMDLLEATFSPGSVVGAPKIRAMQIIRDAEPFARGPYCGAIGWIGLDGQMTLNVAIRTMTIQDGLVEVFAGGGIVAESDPDAEYQEIMAKAAGLLSSLNATALRPLDGRPQGAIMA